MKIVINTCFGGFGVSTEALKELIKRGSKAVEAMAVQNYYGGEGVFRETWRAEYEKDLARCADCGDGYLAHSFLHTLYKDGMVYSLDYDEKFRSDPALVAVVEEMGSEKASKPISKLKVVEIPDGTEWGIHEYAGMEHVEEKHQTWN